MQQTNKCIYIQSLHQTSKRYFRYPSYTDLYTVYGLVHRLVHSTHIYTPYPDLHTTQMSTQYTDLSTVPRLIPRLVHKLVHRLEHSTQLYKILCT